MHVNDFGYKIRTDKKFCRNVCLEFEQDPDYLDVNIHGIIDPSELMDIITMARRSKRVAVVLGYILNSDKADASSISNDVFYALLSFPGRIRNTYLIDIAHYELSIWQLACINRLNICFEAFMQLAFLLCKYDCFTPKDVAMFVRESKVNESIAASSIEYIEKELGDSHKLDVIKNMLCEQLQET